MALAHMNGLPEADRIFAVGSLSPPIADCMPCTHRFIAEVRVQLLLSAEPSASRLGRIVINVVLAESCHHSLLYL